MGQLTVSIVIPNYNYGRFLSEAIDSALAQTYPCKEIIVVDDGSTDISHEVLSHYGDKIGVILQKNSGVGAARNIGVQNVSTDLVAFLDADDYWSPHKIERQVELFENDDEVGLVSCGMQEFDNNGNIVQLYQNGLDGWVADKIVAFNSELVVSGSAIIVKRKVFEKVKGFDIRKELHPSEDWEFCYRVACESKIAFTPEMLVNYRNHGNNGHLKIPQMERAMLLAYESIFKDPPREILELKNESYGNLYSVLAGSYYCSGNYRDFIRTSLRSLRFRPSKVFRYLGYPLRVLHRTTSSSGLRQS